MSAAESRPAATARIAFFCIAGLLLTVPFLFVPTASEAFRAPKLWASELWGLASLVLLAFGLRQVDRLTLAELWRLPAIRAALPLLALAAISRFTSRYPASVAEATVELAIGAACLVGWSVGLEPATRDRLLALLALPAGLLGLLAILQLSGIYRPFGLQGGEEASRMGVISFAGNPGDLAAYLVLPCLLLQARLPDARGARRIWVAIGLALALAGLAATQTLTALAALLVGSLLFWLQRLPRRRGAAAVAAVAGLLLLVVLAVPPLRHRVTEKARAMAAGNAGSLLTYRTDAWRAAFWMLEQHPLAGVGHGAYRSTYASARLALARQGVDYSGAYRQISFFNAHNDALEVGAELGWPGLLALGFAIWTLAQAMRAAPGPRRALTFAGAASLALLALAGFPFETALVAYPWLLFLSGPLAPRRPAEEGAEPVPEPVAKPKPAGGRGPRRRR